MTTDLATTNMLLGIMAAVSVLEALALIGAGIMGYRLYGSAMGAVRDLEQRQVAPLVTKVNDVLVDVKAISARLNSETERVDHAIRDTMERVDETTTRVKMTVGQKIASVVRTVRTVRDVIEEVLSNGSRGSRRQPQPQASGRP